MTRLEPGTRLRSATCSVEILVTHAGTGTLTCGSRPMLTAGDDTPGSPPHHAPDDRTLLGKRYRASGGTLQVLCLRQGPGALELDGTPLELLKPRTLPASD
ncbi:hypothetical protein LO772_34205 [Yinghuangia sp. ASG 101]|uniref:hypothetical protein n=1 Tax=Yinghuangia sp. ASG 101 TaxID=2896848 RepID=UPI001E29949D|nr:hypothetical protein [Yinghuangia sp. ASG 101]UGQ11766.1 hypothetical protein LO772_34205 [Yinghuangia sp. ASG 101]